jgi:hypothetical protein
MTRRLRLVELPLLEVFLLTDQPDGHAGTLARARPDLGRVGQGSTALDRRV